MTFLLLRPRIPVSNASPVATVGIRRRTTSKIPFRCQRRFQSTSSSSTLFEDRIQRLAKDPNELLKWAKGLAEGERQQLSDLLKLDSIVAQPSRKSLQIVALTAGIPFIGFGFLDNAILIVAGDAIDTSLGVLLGISTMCAAAIGNIISDIAGLMLGTAIEDFCANFLRLPTVDLSNAQRRLRSVRFASQLGCGIGLTIGCVIGMFPLLFLDSNKVQAKKRQAHLEAMFRDVVTEAGSLVGATQMSMYLLVDKTDETKSVAPVSDGQFLYNKYSKTEKWIPLGRGLLSRAALTGEAWNIKDVTQEPDYIVDLAPDAGSMLVVPIVDNCGRPVAVLQAINHKGERSFGENDEQILKALASHISVALQRMYDDDEKDSTRIKDTIQMLKDYGLSGLRTPEKSVPWRPLFPEEGSKDVNLLPVPQGFCS